MFAVSDGYSFVTIISILCSFFSLLFSFFNKRNLSNMMKLDEAREAKLDHGGAAAVTELVSDNAKDVPAAQI